MYCQHLRRAFLNSTRTVAAAAASSRRRFLLRNFSDTLPKEESKMLGESEKSQVTRVLFCGPHFPASHNYTREYLAKVVILKTQ
ncbi:unnamed protein product [Linum trigynum]